MRNDADESNWLDEAAQAHPGPDASVHVLYGIVAPLGAVAEVTGEDRDEALSQVLG